MSHMPTTADPGLTTLVIEQAGVAIGAGVFRTLNFASGATAVDAGGGVAQIDVTGGGGGSIPDGSVALTKLAAQAQATIVGRAAAAGSGSPIALTAAQVKTTLAIAAADVSGLAAVATSGSATDLTTGTLAAARLAANSIVAAKFAAASTQRVFGRNTAGAGGGEEVSASQLLDWLSSTNGVLLTRTGGAWVPVGNVTTDNGDFVIADNVAPVAPSSGAKVFSKSLAGLSLPAFLNSTNRASALQPFIGQARFGLWYMSSATTVAAIGTSAPALTGTGTSRVPAATNLCTQTRRVGVVSTTTANAIAAVGAASYNQIWRGNAAGLGGILFVARFAASDASLLTTANMFVGLTGANYTDVAPDSTNNKIGVGCNSGDTVLQLYASGSAAQPRTSLGASFPVNSPSTDVYELILYAPPNGSAVAYRVERLNTGDVASGTISAGANLPANTLFMTPVIARSTGTAGTGSAVGIDFISGYFGTDF